MAKQDDPYKVAVDAAQAELAELSAKLAAMQPLLRRKAMLEVFLEKASELQSATASLQPHATGNGLQVRVAEPVHVGDSVKVAIVPGGGKNIWEGAREVLTDAKHPMTVPWIVKAMRERGWKFEAKWTNEIVRGAIQRKPDIFESLGNGFYALKEWPSEMRKITRDLKFKARHGVHPAATIQSAPEEDDLKGTIFEGKK